MGQGTRCRGFRLPVQGASVNPYEYGKFQNFLPEIQGRGPEPDGDGAAARTCSSTARPSGVEAEGAGGAAGGDAAPGRSEALRDELAKLTAGGGGGGGQSIPGLQPVRQLSPGYATNGVTRGAGRRRRHDGDGSGRRLHGRPGGADTARWPPTDGRDDSCRMTRAAAGTPGMVTHGRAVRIA